MAPDTTRLYDTALADLQTGFRGELVGPADAAYDEHRRIWNGSIDRRPALIARCAGVADVIAAVGFASRTGLSVAVRGGGHSFPGHSSCDGGIVIDLSPMRGIRVDPDRRVARAQAGVLLGELDHETQAFGLAVPSGIVTHTGMAGLTLGGGIGWLMRRYGLTIDQLISVDLVTAAGELLHASEELNPELFWGVRGGGGNFGIVTEFEFRLHPVGPTVMAGPIVWAMEDSPQVMRRYRDWIADVPDELTTIVVHRWAPPLPSIPAELHGRPVVMVISCYAGPVEDGAQVIKPMRSFGTPLLDLCQPKPYLEHQSMFDPGFPAGRWYYFRSCDVAELTDEVIDVTVARAMAIDSAYTLFPIFHLGGAVARGPDTAFGGRSSGHTFNFNGATLTGDGFTEQRDWARESFEALRPYHSGYYVNFIGDDSGPSAADAYGPQRYRRLVALKRRYDPDNVFRLNQNIPPG
ncbi:MAG: FAD-binding oxidoreductase [Micromonosporaceae bacterium]